MSACMQSLSCIHIRLSMSDSATAGNMPASLAARAGSSSVLRLFSIHSSNVPSSALSTSAPVRTSWPKNGTTLQSALGKRDR